MTEKIAEKITAIVSPLIKLYYSEAEVEVYPYATYDMTVEEYRDKDEVYKIVGVVTVDICAKDYSTANSKMISVKAALDSLRDGQFCSKFTSSQKVCREGIWTLSMYYNITQYNNGN